MQSIYTRDKTNIKADIIVLGCNLPGMVTANKLRKKFGDSMDIVVLDLPTSIVPPVISKCNVAFKEENESDTDTSSDTSPIESSSAINKEEGLYMNKESLQLRPSHPHAHSTARQFLIQYGNELKVPLPPCIINPKPSLTLRKLFQHSDGSYVPCQNHYNNFDYLNFIQKFELNQYQNFLDDSIKYLFGPHITDDPGESENMLYYDRTSMEKSICQNLFFSTSREIMRTTVKLVCGVPAHSVSLLFYLHQCYRTCGTRHHIDGHNIRHREKLLGYCRKRITFQLQENIADITMSAKSIKYIGTCSSADVDHMVILETIMGDTTYVCSSLAMALKPEQLDKIEFDSHLLPKRVANIIKAMTPGKAKKFLIQYQDNFWEKSGYSGDILSIRGPIIWAMARPKLSFTGSVQKYAALVGYLMVDESEDYETSERAVVEQLTNLFGPDAAEPVTYRETDISDIIVPKCGDYEGLRVLTTAVNPSGVEWAAFDIFADGDVAAALEAGHTAYVHLLSCLRPQAQTYEDNCANKYSRLVDTTPFTRFTEQINIVNTFRFAVVTTAVVIIAKYMHSYMTKP